MMIKKCVAIALLSGTAVLQAGFFSVGTGYNFTQEDVTKGSAAVTEIKHNSLSANIAYNQSLSDRWRVTAGFNVNSPYQKNNTGMNAKSSIGLFVFPSYKLSKKVYMRAGVIYKKTDFHDQATDVSIRAPRFSVGVSRGLTSNLAGTVWVGLTPEKSKTVSGVDYKIKSKSLSLGLIYSFI